MPERTPGRGENSAQVPETGRALPPPAPDSGNGAGDVRTDHVLAPWERPQAHPARRAAGGGPCEACRRGPGASPPFACRGACCPLVVQVGRSMMDGA